MLTVNQFSIYSRSRTAKSEWGYWETWERVIPAPDMALTYLVSSVSPSYLQGRSETFTEVYGTLRVVEYLFMVRPCVSFVLWFIDKFFSFLYINASFDFMIIYIFHDYIHVHLSCLGFWQLKKKDSLKCSKVLFECYGL